MKTIKDLASIIIPSYKGVSLLERNLPYLIQAVAHTKKNHQIIVVNDGGDYATQAFLKDKYPQINVITIPKNFGFGAACNLAAKVSLHPLILFLNNDVRVDKFFLNPMIDLYSQDNVFAVVPKIMVAGTDINESVYEFFFRSGYFMTHLLDKERVDRIKSAMPVPFGCGACLLVDKKKFLQMGGFSSIFHPFYWEDVDLGFRAWKRGWQVLYQPKSIVFHQRGATIGDGSRRPEVDKIFLRNMILFTWKNSHSLFIVLRHLLTLPFDLIFAYVGKRNNYLDAFKEARKYFKESLVLRKKEKREIECGEIELLSFFKSNFSQFLSIEEKKRKSGHLTDGQAEDYKKILILHNRGGMGDIILSVPLAITLKRNFPESRISFMLNKKYVDVVSGIPEIDEIIPFDENEKKTAYYKELLRKIKGENFDLSIELWSNAKDAWLCFLAGIKRRVGQNGRLLYSFLYNSPVDVRTVTGDDVSHWVDVLLDYARVLGIEKLEKNLKFYIPLSDQNFVDSMLLSENIRQDEKLIGIHLSKGIASSIDKWPVEKFAKIADLVASRFGARIIFTGSNDEKKLVSFAQNLMKNTTSLNFAGRLNLKQLGALLNRLDLFICPDSGPIHLAAALKVPCVAIFALKSDFPMRWHPFGTRYEMVRSFPYKCKKKCIKEKCEKFICLEEIDEAEVLRAAEKLLTGV